MPDLTPQAAYQRRRKATQRRVTVWMNPDDAALFVRVCGDRTAQETVLALVRQAARNCDKALDVRGEG